MAQTQSILVRTASAEYAVYCGTGALDRAGEWVGKLGDASGVYFVSSPRVWRLWGRALVKGFPRGARTAPILFDDRETNKRLATLEKICRALVRAGADRQSVLVALGGGVVGDVAGFAAASFLRGVKLIHVPTTLVAQVDSAIGGKTGVNLPEGKNLVGAFYQPNLVIADPDVLRTLPGREYRSGLFEVIKYGVIADEELFHFLEGRVEGLLRQEADALEWVVPRCIGVKAEVVRRDERESGLRQVLNFGHTVAHGLEAATRYRRLLHGEAVGWGMLAAAQIAKEMKLLKGVDAGRIARLIWRAGPLPSLKGVTAARVLAAMRADKKSRDGTLRWVLPRRIGAAELGVEVPGELVRAVVARLPQILARAREDA
jgi:3-dehydroquinate synthase